MRICVVGHFKDNLDEGVRIVGRSIFKMLENEDIDLKKVDINSISNWKDIIKFNPDIIHFILAPTVNGLIIAKLISILSLKSKIIISAVQPAVPQWNILKFLRPDLMLVQSSKSELVFKSIDFKTKFMYNGIDTEKFKPATDKEKKGLREKYKVPLDKFVVLHLASLKRERNLDIFKKIQKEQDNHVIIIGRENENIDEELVLELEESGCEVWIKHFQNIEDIYNLSDCYIFPTVDNRACIETPLSVLESMACNLPVITTKFGAIPDLFDEGNGLFYINGENEISTFIDKFRNENIEIKTRNDALTYSMENVANNLMGIYKDLLN